MQTGALKEHMDLSNFPTDHHLYNEENKGKVGLLKSETGDNPISEVICLAPKCYSALLDDGAVKTQLKGLIDYKSRISDMTRTGMSMLE